MYVHRLGLVAVVVVCLGGLAIAQDEDLPLSNWGAPPYWTPAAVPQAELAAGGAILARVQGMSAQAEALPSSPLPFVAIAPCRIVDTRVNLDDGFHRPNFGDDETRTFNLPASPDCTGLPATSGAWSLNIQFRPISQLAFLTAYPTGTTRPGVSTLTAGTAAWVQNAAIVPAGTAGAIDIYCQYAGRVVIDINGYYGPQSVVTGLNTKTGDVTLAEGSNITITPSPNTLTIAATGGPGGELPAGSANQTLRNNGSAWVASSVLTNDGTNVAVSGNLGLPVTTGATSGVLTLGGVPFLHGYGPTTYANTFVGSSAGSFTGSGTGGNVGVGSLALAANSTGASNTAVGYQALTANTMGNYNSGFGHQALASNVDGSSNEAFGYQTMVGNTSGNWNAAFGSLALKSNTTGNYNSAFGRRSLTNSTGDDNSALGYASFYYLTTGMRNTAVGDWAGTYVTTGSDNTFLGQYSGTDSTHGAISNSTAVGAYALVTASNSIVLGPVGGGFKVGIGTSAPDTTLQVVGDIKVGTGGTNGCLKNFAGTAITGTCSSDVRLKTDVRPFELVLDRVARLQPVHFAWRAAEFPEYHFGAGVNSGLIAQDVEPLFPGMVATDERGYKTVNYSELPYLTLAAVRELKAKADALEAENSDLRAELRRLAAVVAELQARQQ